MTHATRFVACLLVVALGCPSPAFALRAVGLEESNQQPVLDGTLRGSSTHQRTAGLEEPTFPPEAVRITLVEDEAFQLSALQTLVTGYLARSANPLAGRIKPDQIGAFPTIEAAVAWIVKEKPQLVITDLNLPDGLGFDVITAAKQANPSAVVVLASTPYRTQQAMVDQLLANRTLNYFLQKPFSVPREVYPLVDRYIVQRLAAGLEEDHRDAGTPVLKPENVRILWVDDAAGALDLWLKLLRASLPQSGHALVARIGPEQIRRAGTVAEAMAQLNSWPPHLLILDLNLPDGLGFEVARAAKAADPSTIIMMVANPSPKQWVQVQESLKVGTLTQFLGKSSFQIKNLVAAIEQHLGPRLAAGLEEPTFPPEAVRIALVEDDDDILTTLAWDVRRHLATSPNVLARQITAAQIQTFADARDAISWIAAERPQLVITDLNAPQYGVGFDVARVAKGANPAAAVVLASGIHETQRAQVEALAARGVLTAVLEKPFSVRGKLLPLVDQHIVQHLTAGMEEDPIVTALKQDGVAAVDVAADGAARLNGQEITIPPELRQPGFFQSGSRTIVARRDDDELSSDLVILDQVGFPADRLEFLGLSSSQYVNLQRSHLTTLSLLSKEIAGWAARGKPIALLFRPTFLTPAEIKGLTQRFRMLTCVGIPDGIPIVSERVAPLLHAAQAQGRVLYPSAMTIVRYSRQSLLLIAA